MRLVLLLLISSSSMGKLFTKVNVEDSRFSSHLKQTSLINFVNEVVAAFYFSPSNSWTLFCKDDGKNQFWGSNLMVSPLYGNASAGKQCYTTLEEDLAYKATVTASQTYSVRIPEHLTDGLNEWDHDSCSHALGTGGVGVWFLIDLGEPVTIKKILLTAHDGGYDPPLPQKLEVRVGLDYRSGDNFSSYELVRYYEGPSSLGETLDLSPGAPVEGRFISLQKMGLHEFMVCHLQVQ